MKKNVIDGFNHYVAGGDVIMEELDGDKTHYENIRSLELGAVPKIEGARYGSVVATLNGTFRVIDLTILPDYGALVAPYKSLKKGTMIKTDEMVSGTIFWSNPDLDTPLMNSQGAPQAGPMLSAAEELVDA